MQAFRQAYGTAGLRTGARRWHFGSRWGHGAEPDEAGRIFNAYADAGGNFIDTANGYQFGQSEEILGDLLSGRRDEFVLATKFTFQTDPKAGILAGNSRRSMVSSVEAKTGRREGFGGRVFQEENSSHRTAILDTLIGVAKDAGVTPAEIAIAWVAAKGSLPIIGPRTLAQLENNLAAAKTTLSPEQIARLDEVSAIPAVFPYRMLNNPETRQGFTGGRLEQFDAPVEPVA